MQNQIERLYLITFRRKASKLVRTLSCALLLSFTASEFANEGKKLPVKLLSDVDDTIYQYLKDSR